MTHDSGTGDDVGLPSAYVAAHDQVVATAKNSDLGILVHYVGLHIEAGVSRDAILNDLCTTTMHQPPLALAGLLAQAILRLAEHPEKDETAHDG